MMVRLVALVEVHHITLLVGLEQQPKDLRVETIQVLQLTEGLEVVVLGLLVQMLGLMLPVDQTEGMELAHQLTAHPRQGVVEVEEDLGMEDLLNHLVELAEVAEEAPRTTP
jgi:hypothetical protein